MECLQRRRPDRLARRLDHLVECDVLAVQLGRHLHLPIALSQIAAKLHGKNIALDQVVKTAGEAVWPSPL